MRCSMFFWKRILGIFAVLTALICVGLLVTHNHPVYAQVGGPSVPDSRVPDLTGDWLLYIVGGCVYPNVEALNVVPQCSSTDDVVNGKLWRITNQTGRVFAGLRADTPDKLTGYIASDGTVSIQYFSPAPHEREHIFLSAKVGIERGNYVLRGFAHGFSELPMPPRPCSPPSQMCSQPPAPAYMQTAEGYMVKQ